MPYLLENTASKIEEILNTLNYSKTDYAKGNSDKENAGKLIGNITSTNAWFNFIDALDRVGLSQVRYDVFDNKLKIR